MTHLDDTPEETTDHDEHAEKTVISAIKGLDREKQAFLIFLSGPLMGKIFPLQVGEVSLGRGQGAGILINDLGISRQHAAIRHENGHSYLRDLGSTNGTFLNGNRIQKDTELHDGDRIQISSSTILKYAYQDKIENIFHEELYKMAIVDAMTGAYNKKYFEERMKEEFSYCFRNQVPMSLLVLDIDHFKKINDTYGHPAGDAILCRVVQWAKTIIRHEDILARYGGEEFVMILKATDADGALTLAERLRRLIDESEFEFEGQKIHVTASIGIATLKGHNLEDWQEMFKVADDLLYQSKNSGRNRVSF